MRTRMRSSLGAGGALAALLLAGCSTAADEEAGTEPGPASVEPVEGTTVSRVTLTDHAAARLGIETALIEHAPVAGGGSSAVGPAQTSVDAAAIIYDARGRAWVYTSPEPLVYVRARIAIDTEVGDTVFLRAGPPPGTSVVTVGAQELWGTEYEVGED
jgi:hypothetical protein